jgi:hypothetical protein
MLVAQHTGVGQDHQACSWSQPCQPLLIFKRPTKLVPHGQLLMAVHDSQPAKLCWSGSCMQSLTLQGVQAGNRGPLFNLVFIDQPGLDWC